MRSTTPTDRDVADGQPVAVADGLFTGPPEAPRLIASRCRSCAVVTFPAQGSCPACTGTDVAEHLLPRSGSLWSWTVQGFRPKEPYDGPAEFTPYGVGYVDMGGEVVVEGRLTENDPERIAIGQAYEVVLEPYRTDDDGRPVVTFAFAPVAVGEDVS